MAPPLGTVRMTNASDLDLQHDCTCCPLRNDGRLCDLPAQALSAFDRVSLAAAYPAGATLHSAGQTPHGIFILCTGHAKLTATSADGRTLIVHIAEPGEILGLSATILGTPHELSAETIEPSQVDFVRRADFLTLLRAYPQLAIASATQLSLKYRDAQREIRALGLSQTVAEKLARLLLEWAAGADESANGIRINVLLTHEEIGQMLGTTRETVTRLFGEFRRRELIDVHGSAVYLKDRQALAAITRV